MQSLMRLWSVCALSLLLGARLGWSAVEYHVVGVGSYDAHANALNTQGVVVGGGGTPLGPGIPAILRPQYQEIGPVPNALSSRNWGQALGIAGGEVVGFIVAWTSQTDGYEHAFAWNAQQGMRDLGTLGGFNRISQATSVNQTLTITGYSDNAAATAQRPVVWVAGQIADIGTLGGPTGFADAINSSGDVVGESQTPDGNFHATLWKPTGEIVNLAPSLTDSTALAIADDGTVVGEAAFGAGTTHTAFRWTPTGGLVNLGTFPGDTTSRATGVNSAGLIVGSSGTAPNQRAVQWRHGVIEDLTPRLDDATWVLSEALAINEAGQILGRGRPNLSFDQPAHFLLTPLAPQVPAPLVALHGEVHGDFNGDGVEDMAGLDATTQVWVCLAGTPQCTTNGGWAVELVAGDLDGNGITDLAAVAADTTLWVRLNGGGWEQIADGWLTAMVVGDFLGDGRQRLAGVAWDGSLWLSQGLVRRDPWNEVGQWVPLPGALRSLIAGDFTGVGRDQLAGAAYDTSLWFAADVRPTTHTQWAQLPGYLFTMEELPGTPDGMHGLGIDGRFWQADMLGAWYPVD